MLGVDIIKEAETGKLYVLEVNPIGAKWHLSSDRVKASQQGFGFSYYDQFNPLPIVADTLIHVTRRDAGEAA